MKLQIKLIKFLLLIFTIFLSINLQAQTYRCEQENGVVLYTDQPCPPKKQVKTASTPKTTPTVNATATEEKTTISAEKYFEPIDYSQLKKFINPLYLKIFLLISYILMSIICFFAYKRDKLAAYRQQQRTPESRLHLYELLGGWPGGLLAQNILRHKNRKPSYQLKFWLIVSINVIITGYILW